MYAIEISVLVPHIQFRRICPLLLVNEQMNEQKSCISMDGASKSSELW